MALWAWATSVSKRECKAVDQNPSAVSLGGPCHPPARPHPTPPKSAPHCVCTPPPLSKSCLIYPHHLPHEQRWVPPKTFQVTR